MKEEKLTDKQCFYNKVYCENEPTDLDKINKVRNFIIDDIDNWEYIESNIDDKIELENIVKVISNKFDLSYNITKYIIETEVKIYYMIIENEEHQGMRGLYKSLISDYTTEELEVVLNAEGGIYLSEGLWLFPDGSLDEW